MLVAACTEGTGAKSDVGQSRPDLVESRVSMSSETGRSVIKRPRDDHCRGRERG